MTFHEVNSSADGWENWGSCDSCGHFPWFEAGFEEVDGVFVMGVYDDGLSCFGGPCYTGWLDLYELEDSLESFKRFLTTEDVREATEILGELERKVTA